jgi:hypothetical protein
MLMANGNIKPGNPIYQAIVKKTYSDNPDFVIALGPSQAKYITEKCYKKEIPITLLPCGSFDGDPPQSVPDWYDDSKIAIGYCGNVNDAHNPDFISYMIDSILPESQQLILALYGSKAPALIEYAQNKPGVVLVKSVPREQLVYIDIHMVTLLPSFTHYAVPSKAVSAISMGKSIVFCGDKDADNWVMFQDAAWFIPDSEEMKVEIQKFCQDITVNLIQIKAERAVLYSKELTQMVSNSYHFIGDYITNLKKTL